MCRRALQPKRQVVLKATFACDVNFFVTYLSINISAETPTIPERLHTQFVYLFFVSKKTSLLLPKNFEENNDETLTYASTRDDFMPDIFSFSLYLATNTEQVISAGKNLKIV